jgi:hypothetical protein
MRSSLSSLLRLVVLAAMGCSAAAVGISRLAPAAKGWRTPRPVERWSVNRFFLGQEVRGSLWFDARDGRPVESPPESGRPLEYVSPSPWRDERGRSRAVGRWCSELGAGSHSSDVGLALMSLPDGEILERVTTESLPLGFPCWEPGGTSDRILFGACDGRLYLHEFGETADDLGRVGSARGPVPIRWAIDPPGLGDVLLFDPIWASAPGLDDLILVSLRRLEPRPDGKDRYSRMRLWWLRLGEDRRSIVAAGPMLGGADPATDRDERCASIVAREDGARLLSYLERGAEGTWSLRLARIDVRDRLPVPASTRGAVLATECRPTPARFSPDGRWLSCVASTGEGGHIRRVPTDAAGPVGAAPGRAAVTNTEDEKASSMGSASSSPSSAPTGRGPRSTMTPGRAPPASSPAHS